LSYPAFPFGARSLPSLRQRGMIEEMHAAGRTIAEIARLTGLPRDLVASVLTGGVVR